jgi:Peptidase family M23
MKPRLRHAPAVLLVLSAAFAAAFCVLQRPALTFAVDEGSLPRVVRANVVDPARVGYVSRLRSGAGSKYSALGEGCVSMKHYFDPPRHLPPISEASRRPAPDAATAVPIFSPVDGTVTDVREDGLTGMQVRIRHEDHHEIVVILFHVYPEGAVGAGAAVRAGQRVGVVHSTQEFDVAVRYANLTGLHFVSLFELMPDAVFAPWRARGVASPDDLVIPRAQRAAHPLACEGVEFVHRSDPDEDHENWVKLAPSAGSSD